jgi:hypothetical protein
MGFAISVLPRMADLTESALCIFCTASVQNLTYPFSQGWCSVVGRPVINTEESNGKRNACFGKA